MPLFSNGELGESWRGKMLLYWRIATDYPSLSLDLLSITQFGFYLPYAVFKMLLEREGETFGYDALIESLPCSEEDIITLLVLANNEGVEGLFLDRKNRLIGYIS